MMRKVAPKAAAGPAPKAAPAPPTTSVPSLPAIHKRPVAAVASRAAAAGGAVAAAAPKPSGNSHGAVSTPTRVAQPAPTDASPRTSAGAAPEMLDTYREDNAGLGAAGVANEIDDFEMRLVHGANYVPARNQQPKPKPKDISAYALSPNQNPNKQHPAAFARPNAAKPAQSGQRQQQPRHPSGGALKIDIEGEGDDKVERRSDIASVRGLPSCDSDSDNDC